jgi:hypothetical protein
MTRDSKFVDLELQKFRRAVESQSQHNRNGRASNKEGDNRPGTFHKASIDPIPI